MNHHYNDIRSRIDEPPRWWDENAVPRWSEFSPRETSDIYCNECCLLRIACQNCDREFDVCMSRHEHAELFGGPKTTLAERVKSGAIHYGDPPNVECCAAGPTMNSVPIRVIQFWRMDGFDWARVPELEAGIRVGW